MSDAAFKSAPYAAYTTTQLRIYIKEPQELNEETVAKMQAEVDRREKVAAGDWSVMTDGERLRHAQVTGRTRAGNCL
jgi:hypothetical protein